MLKSIVRSTLGLTKVGYFIDFFITPLVALALIATTGTLTLTWPLLAGFGFIAWTLFEYVIHRYVLHREPFRCYHDQHHENPQSYIGTPVIWVWLSYAVLGALLTLLVGRVYAGAFLVGVLAGYFVYLLVHFLIHHRTIRPGSLLYVAKIQHLMHHAGVEKNFGVAWGLWDHVFGTHQARKRIA